jgi:LacI family transcriptional regulator
MQAARRLNYHPNAMAQGLVRRHTNTVGLLFLHSHRPVHTSPSFVLMLDGVLEKATQLRQDTLMYTSYSWSDGRRHISSLLDRRCDGLILVVPRLDNEAVPALREHGIPFVLLAGQSEDPAISTVDTDNRGAAGALVHHLIDLGHRRIAFLHGRGEENYSYCRDRLAGYQRAHAERGLACDPGLRVMVDSLEEQVASLMGLPASQRPTAVFGLDDGMALRTMGALQRLGWRVPEDVSVVGYDDIPGAATSWPGLTTVRQPLKQIGECCVEVLLGQIAKEVAPGQKIILPTELVVRGSLAPPR